MDTFFKALSQFVPLSPESREAPGSIEKLELPRGHVL
jgi:hypothetical protein